MAANDVSAIQPELWSTMVQVPLYKSLVALEVANMRLTDTVKYGDTVHVPTFGDLSAQTYAPGSAITVTNQEWDYNTLVVSSYKHCSFYVDDPRALTLNVDQARELATEAAYQLKNKIDADVFACITGKDGFYPVDNKDILAGTNGRSVSASSGNIINVFAGVRKFLREQNVEETGDWCAVVSPKLAAAIEVKATSVGFNVADATLRNGYAGDFMGFQVYISNNLPTGATPSAMAPSAASVADGRNYIGTGLSASTGTAPSRAVYFGRKGQIDVVMLAAPRLEVRKLSDRLGSNFITWTVYGQAVFNKSAARGVNMTMLTAYA
jgi:hypothetical protein